MKQIRVAIITVLMVFLLSITVFADGKNSASNLFLFSESVNTTNEVKGDIYAFAQDININNIVGGDVISGGQNIKIMSEKISGNIRVAGQILNIDVKHTKNITVAGEEINIGKNTNCNAVYAAGQDINFKGVTNDLYLAGENIVIDGDVKGELNVDGENVIISENANILGNVNIKSPNEPTINAKIDPSNINYNKVVTETSFKEQNTFNIATTLMSMLTAVIIGLLLFVIFRGYFYEIEKNVKHSIGENILVGLGAFIIIPIVSILLFITVIGIPIGLIFIIFYVLLMYLCPMISGITLGQIIIKDKNEYLQVLVGVLTMKILLLIPYIDTITWLVCVLFTLGCIVLKAFSMCRRKSQLN
ncbi:hypothetical protein [Romboutsia sp.]|uniref:hypothetical protein n=1 Tax=Romboutsia sp. TaxID=1965302 RepID=UPI002BC8BB21|nr:hypothetical protein [Romboutsia sp.]HSQ88875.1 hypothetical protein [Romboutsia sp.]